MASNGNDHSRDKDKTYDEIFNRHFEEKINQSGIPLENKVEEFLHYNVHSYVRDWGYMDKDENKTRSIDFVAEAPCYIIPMNKGNPIVLTVQLIIECKKIPDNAWIFSGRDEYTVPVEYVLSRKTKTERIETIIPVIQGKLFTASSCKEIFYKGDIIGKNEIRSNGKDINFKDAVAKVSKATRHRIESIRQKRDKLIHENKKVPNDDLHLIQSVIIFQGRMYRTVERDDKTDIVPIKFAKMRKNFKSNNYDEKEGEIHIVSFDGLKDYFEVLKKYYKINKPTVGFFDMFGFDRHKID